MKILHVVGTDFKAGNGITVITNELIKELNLQGMQAELFLLKSTEMSTDYVTHQNISNYDSFFKKHTYDLVIFHGLFFVAYTKIAKSLNAYKTPYLIRPHSSLMRASHKKGWLKKQLAFLLLFNRFISGSSAILFSNEEERANSKFSSKKYYIEPNGVSFEEEDKTVAKHSTSAASGVKLLFLSRIDFSHKGIDFLLNGFNEYVSRNKSTNIELAIYGTGDKSEVDRLKSMIKKSKFIRFFGPIFGEDKERLLESSDILLLTSRYEGFPTIFIDVLTQGIPVIITPGTNAGYFETEGVGWLSELSADSIASTIERAIEDFTNNRIAIKERCIQFSRHSFDIKSTVLESISIYRDIVS